MVVNEMEEEIICEEVYEELPPIEVQKQVDETPDGIAKDMFEDILSKSAEKLGIEDAKEESEDILEDVAKQQSKLI